MVSCLELRYQVFVKCFDVDGVVGITLSYVEERQYGGSEGIGPSTKVRSSCHNSQGDYRAREGIQYNLIRESMMGW